MEKKRIDKKHSFNVIIAEKYTVQKALIIEEILNWCEYNKLKRQNFFNGKYWTRRTAKEYHKQFPYMNEKSIDRWLKELVEDGILYVGKFNKKKFDKTNWHCVNLKKYNSILYVPQNEVCVPQNEVCVPQNEETIPTPEVNSLSKEYGECVNTQKTPPIEKEKEIEKPTQDDPVITITDENKSDKENLRRDSLKTKRSKFIPPTEIEAANYAEERIRQKYPDLQNADQHAESTAEDFVNFYGCKNWMVGKTKMKNWKFALNRWIKKNYEEGKYSPRPNASNYDNANNTEERYGAAKVSDIKQALFELDQEKRAGVFF